MATDGIRYIKIAKIDKNGNNQTNTLQSLNQVTIPFSTGNITYKVNNITEHPTFFLYYVDPAGVEWADRAEIKYDFTGSINSLPSQSSDYSQITFIPIEVEYDNLNFFTNTVTFNNTTYSGSFYYLRTYPQKSIHLEASGSISATSLVLPSSYTLYLARANFSNTSRGSFLASASWDPSSVTTQSFHLTSSDTSIPGDIYYLQLASDTLGRFITSTTLSGTPKFFVTSSNATGLQVGLVPEPYFGSNDFKRALDCQPLLNNVERVRRHNLYQDVDYSAGITEPVNFDLLISGSATRAEVQFSNYTTKRVIIPRYEGSKSTSQKLNKWTKGDTGTYGKSPTIESLKTVIAYCDWIGAWPPELSDSSAAHILYLIDSDGNISIPNTSETSLPNVQGAFQTGERFRISSKTIGSGEVDQFRTVIRGGQRIEPILYTQSGSAPNQQWNTTMSFEDIIPSVDGTVGNYLSTNTPPLQTPSNNVWEKVDYTWSIIGNIIGSNSIYEVPLGVIQDGVTLKVEFKRIFEYNSFIPASGTNYLYLNFRVVKKRGSSYTYYPQEAGFDQLNLGTNPGVVSTDNFIGAAQIPPQDLQEGDEIYIECFRQSPGTLSAYLQFPNGEGYFKVTSYPLPTQDITSSGHNSIWNWGDANNYPYIITSSNQTLIDIYDETAKQTDIAGSGFNPIALPFSIKYGDEFRFEGREDFSYVVKEIYAPYEKEGRIFPTGSIEVHFSENIPTGSSQSVFNLDHFLIRRYVDDASQILMEGFKPLNSAGPYILTPEYTTKELNVNIDDVITDLRERGLITGEEGT